MGGCKKVENWGGVVKKVENGGFFVKKVDLSSTQGALCTVGLSVFFILHFTYSGGAYCVHTQRTPALPAYAQTTGQPKHTMLPRSTQPCVPPGSLNRVPASAAVRAGMSPLPGGR